MIKQKILSILLVAFGCVALTMSSIKIKAYLKDNVVSDNGNEMAASMRCDIPEAIDNTTNEKIDIEDEMDIRAMQEINPDTVGFLKVQDKELPVVKSENNKKYMKTGWDGKRTSCGTIFMDNYCGLDGKNIILYGHHMKSGKMFGTLNKYLSKEYRDENPTFKWITEDYVDTYTIVAVIKSNASDIEGLLDMDLKSDIDSLTEKAKSTNTLYEELHSGKSYMSLVTCEYTVKSGRLIVIGERVKHLVRK